MKKEERERRNEQMRRYKAEGHSMQEVADKFRVTKGLAQIICKGINPQSHRRCKTYNNGYTTGSYDRIQNCKRVIANANNNLEYLSGFTSIDGRVWLKCKKCGYEFERSLVTLRHRGKNHECPQCKAEEQIKETEQKKAEKKRLLAKARKEKRLDRILAMPSIQIEMKPCPVCSKLFLGYKTYCSDQCRNQNKWAMKDRYRMLFPLEEVYERDKGVCYICGGFCDWNDKDMVNGVIVYGNLYPSRDHVIPKSKGGANTWDNIRLAHRICNSRKSDAPLV